MTDLVLYALRLAGSLLILIVAMGLFCWLWINVAVRVSERLETRHGRFERPHPTEPADDLMAVADAVDDWGQWSRELAAGDAR